MRTSAISVHLQQRLADTEAMLSLSLSLILELTDGIWLARQELTHNNFAEEIPPVATDSGITEETLIQKKDTVLKFYENSTSSYRRSGKIGTPDTSAEKRERQEEWEGLSS
ncbi:hypothetical protein H072_7516 [Dactylellina haptotyla CBS 200.50]|uniref:Uncharacterized protein n=1 Tax=Dactylellina haptotyla (strain CBS 200.50) TaxID=1284197 RepID=S8A6R5_DACHA|nr:hypothetical protein H072_7516 [Dactylellina haptotyla CBS 200.50]